MKLAGLGFLAAALMAGCTVRLGAGCAFPVRRAGWLPEPSPPAAVVSEYSKHVSAEDTWFRRPDGSLLACSRYDAQRDDCGTGGIRFPFRDGRYEQAELSICSYDRGFRREVR